MKFIVVIRGVSEEMYEGIRRDIVRQCEINGYFVPVFAYLPNEEPAIEIVWTDKEVELEHLAQISKQLKSCDCE